jgi:hypothetical protein
MYIHVYAYIRVNIFEYFWNSYGFMCMHTYMYVYVYIFIYMYIYDMYIKKYIYIYKYIYTYMIYLNRWSSFWISIFFVKKNSMKKWVNRISLRSKDWITIIRIVPRNDHSKLPKPCRYSKTWNYCIYSVFVMLSDHIMISYSTWSVICLSKYHHHI